MRGVIHYRSVEPENRLVACQLARDWEKKLAEEKSLQEEYQRFVVDKPRLLSASERESIRRLAADIPALWNAASTTNAQRKEIIRQVIERVVVEVEGDSERVEVRIEWAGGRQTTAVEIRPVSSFEQLSYYPQLCERVRELWHRKGWRALSSRSASMRKATALRNWWRGSATREFRSS